MSNRKKWQKALIKAWFSMPIEERLFYMIRLNMLPSPQKLKGEIAKRKRQMLKLIGLK